MLKRNYVTSPFEQARRVCMPELMQCCAADLGLLRNFFKTPKQMGDPPTLVIGKEPVGVTRQLFQNRHQVWRNGNYPLFVILRRKSFFTVATHADSRQFQIHIPPSEKVKFTFAQAR